MGMAYYATTENGIETFYITANFSAIGYQKN